METLTKDWESFVKVASKSGFLVKGSFKESNPLLHVCRNGVMGYFCSGTGPSISTNGRSPERTDGDKVTLQDHSTKNPLSVGQPPSLHKSRSAEDGYIVLIERVNNTGSSEKMSETIFC